MPTSTGQTSSLINKNGILIMKNILTASLMLLVMTMSVMAQEKFCIAKNGNTAAIVVDEQDWKGVARAANDLGDDVRKVCGTACSVVSAMSTDKPNIVVGTIGKSSIINKFIKQKKLDVNKVKGQWESFVIDVVDGNLVVAGSDKRGTSMASMR